MFRKVAKGIGWTFIFVFLAKGIGAAKEMAVAAEYGVSATLDAYLFTFAVITLPLNIWFNVGLTSLVPILSRQENQNRELFTREFLAFSVLLAVLIFAIEKILLATGGMKWLLPGNSQTMYPLMEQFSNALIVYVACLIPTMLFSAQLISAGRHSNVLVDAIPATVMMATVSLLTSDDGKSLIYGTLLGGAVTLVLFWWLTKWNSVKTIHSVSRVIPNFASLEWKQFRKSSSVMLLAQIPANSMMVVDQVILSMATAGAISHFSYANRVLSLLTSLGGMAISRVLLPIVAEEWEKRSNNQKVLAAQFFRIAFTMGGGGLAALVVGWVLAPHVVEALFQRGNFLKEDTLAVTEIFRLLLLQLPFYLMGVAFVQILGGIGQHAFIAKGSLLNFVVKVGGSWLMFNWYGVQGVALSFCLMYLISSVYLYLCARRATFSMVI